VRFLLVAGDVDLHRRRGKEEGEKSKQIHCLLSLLAAAHETTRRQWRGRVEQLAATVSALLLRF
jgi:hypothetical protein